MGLFTKPSNVETSVKKVLSTLSIALMASVFLAVFSSPVMAKVTGQCANCHTMHASQSPWPTGLEWDPSVEDNPKQHLLVQDCVGCHSDSSFPIKVIGSSRVPVVFITGGEPSDYLAGGNFWWVADSGGNDDTKGHNVLGISGEDQYLTLTGPQQAPGNQQAGRCKTEGCHGSLARENTHVDSLGSGCEGCHLRVRHHADDKTDLVGDSYRVTTEDQGWYRFLAAHSGNHVKPFGVNGIEDADWQQLSKASNVKHNEYRGSPGDNQTYTTLNNAQNPTVTAFCCGCHGEFHVQQDQADGPWIRHPSDAVLPDDDPDSEYEAYTIYDPLAPVARASLNGVSSDVTAGTDMVMCLSCHRPHGSPYPDMLRWDYENDSIAGTTDPAKAGKGCFVCHTEKDGVE